MHKLVTSLHPKNILTALDAIDAEAPSYSLNRAQALRRVFITLATVSVCLLFIHYLKHFSSFNALLQMLSAFVYSFFALYRVPKLLYTFALFG